ncbi:MAG: S1C family serine protease, partial [Blautia producta]
EQVVVIGNALGYGQSVTTGIVSAVNRSIRENTQSSSLGYIQTDAAINPGNSGGALLDMEGKLVGINTAKISSTEVEGIGYAIPISQVLELVASLMEEN